MLTARLDELCEGIFDCPHSTPVWTPVGKVVLRSFNIRNGRLDVSDPSYTDEIDFRQRIRRAQPEPNDIVITREAPMGEVAMIPQGLECCLGQRMVLLKPDPKRVDPRYLLYALQGAHVQTQIRWSEGAGATVSNLRIPHLCALDIPLVNRSQQSAIGNLLRALDDKIELNSRMCATLEEMARAIFRSWFIDFDPVRAKVAAIAEGRDPERAAMAALSGKNEEDLDSLPSETLASLRATAAFFPDSFSASELGQHPSGWAVLELGKILTESQTRVERRNVPEYSSTNNGLEPRSLRFKKTLSANPSKNKLIRRRQLVFGLSRRVLNFGLMREEIGSVSQAYRVYSVDETVFGADLIERFFRERPDYYYGAVSASSREGQSVSPGSLLCLQVVQPPAELRKLFKASSIPLLELKSTLGQMSETLGALRDTLLPKLLSGELTPQEADNSPELELSST